MLVHLNCPKREKTAFFGRKQTNYPLKSWETDKLQIFFEIMSWGALFSDQIKGFAEKTIFDDFMSPRAVEVEG